MVIQRYYKQLDVASGAGVRGKLGTDICDGAVVAISMAQEIMTV